MFKKVVIGCDHAGYVLKDALVEYLIVNKYQVIDLGTNNVKEAVDYPDYAKLVAENIISKKADVGILICGTGIGMSISANRFSEIRAALCYETTVVKLAREHNDANVLCLGARIIAKEKAIWILEEFLQTSFNKHHQIRVNKIELGDKK